MLGYLYACRECRTMLVSKLDDGNRPTYYCQVCKQSEDYEKVMIVSTPVVGGGGEAVISAIIKE